MHKAQPRRAKTKAGVRKAAENPTGRGRESVEVKARNAEHMRELLLMRCARKWAVESRSEFGLGGRERRGEMAQEAILRRRAELATWQRKTDWRVQETSLANSAFLSAASQNQALLNRSTSVPVQYHTSPKLTAN